MTVKRFAQISLAALSAWLLLFSSQPGFTDELDDALTATTGTVSSNPCENPDYDVQTVTDDYAYPEDWLQRENNPGTIDLDADLPCTGVTWTVWGNGASINNSGVLTLSSTACGSFIAIARDSCGNIRHQTGQLGHWATICEDPPNWTNGTCNGVTYRTLDFGTLVLEERKQCHMYHPWDQFASCGGYTAEDFGQTCEGGCPYINTAIRVKHWVTDCP